MQVDPPVESPEDSVPFSSGTDSPGTDVRRLRTSWGKTLPTITEAHAHHTEPWYKVMCLTGVDYFSTLGYQPGIAYLAAGALAPLATLILILVTLIGALPTYSIVARCSPNGEGSIAMLEQLLNRWRGKLLVLALLGFAATDFVITITLSAADATAHVAENVHLKAAMGGHPILFTMGIVILLGVVFWRGFSEAVTLAVGLVVAYLALNAVVIAQGLVNLAQHPEKFSEWHTALFQVRPTVGQMLLLSLVLFPKLALGLSGFETGVAVMPLVKGDPDDTVENPAGRIKNTRKLLLTVAALMSAFLLGSSLVTTLLIPADAFRAADLAHNVAKGEANGRALAYLAHEFYGSGFGTVYDVVTILILWFAGASAMAGLLNLVPRYLPRYGMAPEWARERRPLVLVFTGIALLVTYLFKADVDAQGGAYATGVLVLMCSAAFAVTLECRARRSSFAVFYGLVTLVFIYTTALNVYERPDGVKIAGAFIMTIVCSSLWSRLHRSTELRAESVEFDELAHQFLTENAGAPIRLIANRRDRGDLEEYQQKEQEQREFNHIPKDDSVLFLEVQVGDASDFGRELVVRGERVGPYRVLKTDSPAVSNAIAALLLHVRDITGSVPHAYFGWKEGNPALFLLGYLAFGEGDIAPLTREVLRRTEPDPYRRPRIHVA